MKIHPTAIISPTAIIAKNAVIGPYCIIGDHVIIGEHSVLHSHIVVKKNTRIGKHNQIFQFCSVGEDSQDLKYQQETTWLEIGDHNTIREGCTLHRGTVQDNSLTKIGNHNLLMANVHIAHDCVLGNHNILANTVGLAGHVKIGNYVLLGGLTGVHQFCHLGDYCMAGASTLVRQDVLPFGQVAGNPARSLGINREGLSRKNWSDDKINLIEAAYKIAVNRTILNTESIKILTEEFLPKEPMIQLIIDAINNSSRGFTH